MRMLDNLKSVVPLNYCSVHHFASNSSHYRVAWPSWTPPDRSALSREWWESGKTRASSRMTAWGFLGSLLISRPPGSPWGSREVRWAAVGIRGQAHFASGLSISGAASWLRAAEAWRLGSMPLFVVTVLKHACSGGCVERSLGWGCAWCAQRMRSWCTWNVRFLTRMLSGMRVRLSLGSKSNLRQ